MAVFKNKSGVIFESTEEKIIESFLNNPEFKEVKEKKSSKKDDEETDSEEKESEE